MKPVASFMQDGLVALVLGVTLLITPQVQAEKTLRATEVWYLEREPGIDPYRVRYLVTPRFMRSDEGSDSGAYTLFDRQQKTLYSVVPANRAVLRIDGRGELPVKPATLKLEIDARTETDAPAIGDSAPIRLDLKANGETCHSAMVVPGLLPGFQVAMQAFTRALAVHQGRTLDNTPPEYRTPCFLARLLHAGDFHWRRGNVLAEWNARGERRDLIDYAVDVEVSPLLFEVPQDYFVLPGGGSASDG